MSTKSRADPVEEEEDLDDLDDVISKFTPNTSKTKPTTAAPATKPSLPVPEIPAAEDLEEFDDEFAKELAQGMESLMRELSGVGAVPGAGDETDGDMTEQQKAEFKAAWEAMLVEGMNGMADPEEIAGKKEEGKGKQADKEKAPGSTDFQSMLRSAMENIHESESNIKKEGEGSGLGDESPAALLQQLLALSEKDVGSEDTGDIADMFQNIMDTIISKEVLYEPISELRDQFPGYLKENSTKISKSDLDRYNSQVVCINKISALFEDPKYSDTDPTYKSQVAELMEKLQAHGAPPSELMKPLPGLGDGIPEQCTIS